MRDTLVVCPLYNERQYLKDFYRRLRSGYSSSVLFVDDGSVDGSGELLCAIEDPDTDITRHSSRHGYGAALITGFRYALENGFRRIVTIDVDLQHDPVLLPSFFRMLDECQVVLGSRYIRIENYLDVPRERLVINRYIGGVIHTVFGMRFTDPFCGFRGYRSSFIKKTLLKEPSYGIALEILTEIVRLRCSYQEIPVEAVYFNLNRSFLDGLKEPRERLLYYLGVLSRAYEKNKKKDISLCKSPS